MSNPGASFFGMLTKREEILAVGERYKNASLQCQMEPAAFDSPGRRKMVAEREKEYLEKNRVRGEKKAAALRKVRRRKRRIKVSLLVKRYAQELAERSFELRLSALGQLVPKNFREMKLAQERVGQSGREIPQLER